MDYLFKSKRLGFRNWEATDVHPFADINADPEVMFFFPNVLSYEASAIMVKRMQTNYHKVGHTFFAVDELETQDFIGFIGLVNPRFDAFFTPCTEIGWRLKKAVWNKGYATEGALACLDFAFFKLGLKEVYSFTAAINKKSQHIMKKIGMEYQGGFDHPKLADNHPLTPHVVYKIVKFQP